MGERGGVEAEFTVEPFVVGRPGPHVLAALDACEDPGVVVEHGPFGTRLLGADGDVAEVLGRMIRAAMEAGASRVTVQVQRDICSAGVGG